MRAQVLRFTTVAMITAAASSTMLPAAVAQSAADGCPNGYSLIAVADLGPNYQVPGRVDDPTSGILSFGRAGNGDGFVCAVQLGNRTTPWGGPIYNFWDNTLRA